MAVKKIAKNIKFEEALAELEEQVRLLESGELSLEESLDVYKYGVELSKVCSGKIRTRNGGNFYTGSKGQLE